MSRSLFTIMGSPLTFQNSLRRVCLHHVSVKYPDTPQHYAKRYSSQHRGPGSTSRSHAACFIVLHHGNKLGTDPSTAPVRCRSSRVRRIIRWNIPGASYGGISLASQPLLESKNDEVHILGHRIIAHYANAPHLPGAWAQAPCNLEVVLAHCKGCELGPVHTLGNLRKPAKPPPSSYPVVPSHARVQKGGR